MKSKAQQCELKTVSCIVVVPDPAYEEDDQRHRVSYRDHDQNELAHETIHLMNFPIERRLQHSLGDSILVYTPDPEDLEDTC